MFSLRNIGKLIIFFGMTLLGFLLFVFFEIKDSFFLYKAYLALVSLVCFFSLNKRNFFLLIFFTFYLLFFIGHVTFSPDIATLGDGIFLRTLHLDIEGVRTLFLVLIVYNLSLYAVNLVFKNRSENVAKTFVNQKELNIKFIHFWTTFLFLFISNFYIKKIIAIQVEGYLAYHLGIISIKKGIIIVFIELLLLIFLYYGIWKKSNYSIILFVIYNILILFTGLRMPVIVNLVCLGYFIFSERILKNGINIRQFGLFLGISTFIGPPVLIFIQRIRVGNVNFNFFETLRNSYNEVFTILGFTSETLKSAISIKIDDDVFVSLFYKFTSLFKSAYLKITENAYLSLDDKIEYGSFAAVVTKHFDPNLFYNGVSIGSSFIAEGFLALGFTGIILAVFFHVFLSEYLLKLDITNNFSHFVILFVLAPRFLNSIRGDLIGWFFEAVIYIFVFMSFYKLMRLIKIPKILLKSI